jgi:hypothetical protein
MPSRLIPEGMSVNKTSGDGWTHYDYGIKPQQSKAQNYLGQYNAFSNPVAGQVEGGAAQGFFYNPTGKQGAFQPLVASALDDPKVYEAVRNRYMQFGNDPVWLEQLNKASDAARKGSEGGSFTMDPGVLQKMWK